MVLATDPSTVARPIAAVSDSTVSQETRRPASMTLCARASTKWVLLVPDDLAMARFTADPFQRGQPGLGGCGAGGVVVAPELERLPSRSGRPAALRRIRRVASSRPRICSAMSTRSTSAGCQLAPGRWPAPPGRRRAGRAPASLSAPRAVRRRGPPPQCCGGRGGGQLIGHGGHLGRGAEPGPGRRSGLGRVGLVGHHTRCGACPPFARCSTMAGTSPSANRPAAAAMPRAASTGSVPTSAASSALADIFDETSADRDKRVSYLPMGESRLPGVPPTGRLACPLSAPSHTGLQMALPLTPTLAMTPWSRWVLKTRDFALGNFNNRRHRHLVPAPMVYSRPPDQSCEPGADG